MYFLEHLFLLTAALYYTAGCPAPERIDNFSLNGELKDNYAEGESVTYSCYPGFSRVGQIKQICSGGKWVFTNPKGQCKRRSCGHPGDIPFGSFELKEGDSFVFGAVVEYSCDEGYQLVSKQDKRECTATGWTNFPPHCEVRRCPPIPAKDNVKVLSTSYDDEYSVGQVVRFECTDSKLKVDGPTEIFCTAGGEWNSAPPTCVEITCDRPNIPNGKVTRQTNRDYKENDKIYFECYTGFRASRNGESTCSKMGWSPSPYCEEITCNQYQQVSNGRLISEKSAYKEGDEIALQCNDGFTIQVEPTKPRVCTSNGWSPPAACISRRCEEPEVKNGRLSSRYYFPKQPGSYIYYKCNDGFRTHGKKQEEYTYCTATGWDPETKCFKLCDPLEAVVVNANVHYTQRYVYLEGEKVPFYCHDKLRTPDGKNNGEITCLSDGKFSSAKCSSTCKITKLQHGKYAEIEERKEELELGDSLRYECEDGYKSPNDNIVDSAQCTIKGWDVKPECKVINCERDGYTYASGKRIQYSCPSGQRHSGSNLTQCFYYGLGPQPICEDINCVIPEDSNLIQSPRLPTYKVNTAVSISCPGSLKRNGAKDIICTAHGWHPQLPVCEAEQSTSSKSTAPPKTTVPTKDPVDIQDKIECAPAHSPANAKIEKPLKKYYSGDIVKMKCDDGFKMHGSASIQCNNGVWESPPQCIPLRKCKELPSIINGKYDTASGRVVKYSCNTGYVITGSDTITCDDGKWTTSPICTGIPCGAAPDVQNAFVKERNRVYVHGESAVYQCKDGFIPSGSSSAECIEGQWKNYPTCVDTSCGPAPNVDNADLLRGKDRYVFGESASYKCKSGYSLEQDMKAEAVCSNGEWKDKPVCMKIGGNCGPPPSIEYGIWSTNSKTEETYKSGSKVLYQCPNWYVLEGKKEIKCVNGAWEKAPVCLKPCTITKKEMDENNLYLRWRPDPKIYSENGQITEFTCKEGHEPLSGIGMRQTCNQGVVQYPKCLKSGFCELEVATMKTHNIISDSPVVEQGDSIEFKCNEGMVKETDLKATCVKGKITYPRCKAAASCSAPDIAHQDDKTKKDSYDSGSSVEILCKDNHVLSGNKIVMCNNGQWDTLPTCDPVKPCQISTQDINANNVQLVSPSDLDKNVQHGAEVKIVCKTGHKRPTSLKAVCDNGKMKYHRCFSGDACRLKQEDIDTHNLELDEKHDGEVYYGEGEQITFICKQGYHISETLIGKCSKKEIHYPTCTE